MPTKNPMTREHAVAVANAIRGLRLPGLDVDVALAAMGQYKITLRLMGEAIKTYYESITPQEAAERAMANYAA